MANWKTLSVKDTIKHIQSGDFVLPVIQRELVWKPDAIISLFDTLLCGESFGGIMTVIDIAKREPLFEYRRFVSNYQQGQTVASQKVGKLNSDITYIIDGQQRLSAFYIGLIGDYDNRSLYFDLFSEHEHYSFNLEFAQNELSLPKRVDNYDGSVKITPLWYRMSALYDLFEGGGYDYTSFCDGLIDDLGKDFESSAVDRIKTNLYKVQAAFFASPAVGLCGVPVNHQLTTIGNRLKIVHLFQKLNQGGTILSGLELMRSVLKAYSGSNETFLNEVKTEFADIGFNQDEVIKLVFLLQDNPGKDIVDIEQADSDFLRDSGARVKLALYATRSFLKNARLYEYFTSCHPSIIPLTFIAYHLFHLRIPDERLSGYFNDYETFNQDFAPMRRWLLISLLQHVFQQGNGWKPNTTGRKKIFWVMKENKGKVFPIDSIFETYRQHPLNEFDADLKETLEWLNWYERPLVVFLLYGQPQNFRPTDVDHIHPQSILVGKKIEWTLINSLGNFQYLNSSDNRSKQDAEFGDWINNTFAGDMTRLHQYLELHTIPTNPTLWSSGNFDNFLVERNKLIFEKLSKAIAS